MKKLFVIDLDGTTLQSFTKLHSKVIEGVNHVKKLGHDVMIATGRNVCAARRFYDEMGLDTPLICANGTVITNPKDSNFEEFKKFIDRDIIDFITSEEIAPLINQIYYYKDDYLMMDKEDTQVFEYLFSTGCDVLIGPIKDQDEVLAISVFVKKEYVEQLKTKVKEDFPKVYISTFGSASNVEFLEINSTGINKWQAIRSVKDYLGVDEDNIYTFGDAMNDFEMIKNAKNGIALRNSDDRIKEVANQVLDLSNEEGAVGEFLLNIKD